MLSSSFRPTVGCGGSRVAGRGQERAVSLMEITTKLSLVTRLRPVCFLPHLPEVSGCQV